MDWKIMASTFAAVFLAELGDKTQLATFTLAAGAESKISVLLGAALALIATTVVAVLAGSVVGQLIPVQWLKRAAGVVFIILGIVYLVNP